MRRAWFILLMLLIGEGHYNSMTVLPMKLDEMTRASRSIFHARVIGVKEEMHETLGIPVSVITLQPEECLKGSTAPQVQFRQVKGIGLPLYSLGEEIVIFLYPESKANVTSPVGGVQGLFKVVATQEGKAVTNLYPHILAQENAEVTSNNAPSARALDLESLKVRIRATVNLRGRNLR